MHPAQRVVVSLPLRELWDAAGPVAATRGRGVGIPEITAILRNGPVQFIVADAGPLRWVPPGETYTFWKAEVKPRLVPADADRFRPDEFRGGYCYVATEWNRADRGRSILVLLERHH